VARSTELVNEFALDVARVTNDPRDAILVFHGSCWQRSHELYVATQQASFDDLILARSLKEQIRGDFQRFLGARSAYEDLGLAWRRGALFLGPPGNGKTHCLRALVRELNVPSLYVQSVKARYETEEANLKKVFDRARQLRPCVLVVEDIDALINGENRSFFLNQLDGFEKNVGLIVLATTNHPERIDPAILDRPSRFDRKYHFDLPESEERRAYLALWQTKLAGKLEWSAGTTEALVTRTVGFSFAYLKELVVAALMKSVSGDVSAFSVLLERECETLAAEMATRKTATTLLSATPTDVGDAEDDD
jgi:SpoVK/Ycf46/Vps4 family AAA+-type ATPase